jgi:hypothetical protein
LYIDQFYTIKMTTLDQKKRVALHLHVLAGQAGHDWTSLETSIQLNFHSAHDLLRVNKVNKLHSTLGHLTTGEQHNAVCPQPVLKAYTWTTSKIYS